MYRATTPAALDDPPSLTDTLIRQTNVWHAAVLAETRDRLDERRLREADPRLLTDVGPTRDAVARGGLRSRREG